MLEIEVASVSNYCDHIVSAYRQTVHTRVCDVSAITFYRGQADYNWQLAPRLYRDGLFHNERALIQEIMRIRPREFDGMNDIDRIVKMQHYGLPTRLIDMTTNPLVALFFACWGEEQREVDGRVFVFPSLPVFRHYNRAITIIAHYIAYSSDSSVEMSKVLEDLRRAGIIGNTKDDDQALSEITRTLEIPFHALIPNATNDRLRIQDGAFLVPGMKALPPSHAISGRPADSRHRFGPRMLSANLTEIWRSAFTVRIPASAKNRLLGELSLLGISRGKMFPELEHQASYVVELVRSGGRIEISDN